jgi:hypothetical protein
MAAAADRLVGDVLENVTPELVLVDAALGAQVRDRLPVPDDTLTQLRHACGDEHSATEPAGAIVEHHHVGPAPPEEPELGIDDLIVITAEERPRTEGMTNGAYPQVAAILPARDTALPPNQPGWREMPPGRADLGIDDLIVISEGEHVEKEGSSRMYPALPTRPPADPYEEDATDVALRQIREHIEPDEATRPRHRMLDVVSVVAALSAAAILALDVRLGVLELPGWLPL